MNVGNTEAMGCRIKNAEASEELENAIKERVSGKVDGGEMWGSKAPAKGAKGSKKERQGLKMINQEKKRI